MHHNKGRADVSEIKSNLYPCAHCQESGTCSSGKDSQSCNLCVKRNELTGKGHFGLACGICGGLGKAEPMTERMNKRITPVLSIAIVLPLLVMVWWAMIVKSGYFTELIAFASAIIGTVVGFYFSASKNA